MYLATVLVENCIFLLIVDRRFKLSTKMRSDVFAMTKF